MNKKILIILILITLFSCSTLENKNYVVKEYGISSSIFNIEKKDDSINLKIIDSEVLTKVSNNYYTNGKYGILYKDGKTYLLIGKRTPIELKEVK